MSTGPGEWVDAIGAHSAATDALSLLDHEETDESHLLRLLRKRDLPAPVIEAVARHARWNARNVIRAAIVMHAKTPRTLALRLLGLLLWRDQLRVATNLRLAVPLRVAAESRLRERYVELEMGEKISLARTAPGGLVPLLAEEPDARVIGALLHNPRLGEVDVMSIVRREKTPAEVLRIVALSERWMVRPPIRLAVLCHRATPVHVALSLLGRMSSQEIQKLVAARQLPPIVKLSAERILESARS
jgi:hypothetical protein